MPQRQDYLERMLEELRHSLAEAARYRQAGSPDAALMTLLQAQERLFVRTVTEFMTRPVAEQVRLLAVGDTAAHAREKCLAYATLLTEAGGIYAAQGLADLARGADEMALHVVLLAAQQGPPAEAAGLRPRIAALRERLPGGALNVEVRELLRRADGGA